MGKDASSLDSTKVERRSTTREAPTTTRRSHSARTAAKCSRTENGCSAVPASNVQLLIRGGPPAVVGDTGKQSAAATTVSTCRKSSRQATNHSPNGLMPSVLSASVTQEKPATSLGAVTGNHTVWRDTFTR